MAGTVVDGLDGSSSSRRALHWAHHQAELTGATLRIVWAWEFPASLGLAPGIPEGWNPEGDARAEFRSVLAATLPADGPVEVQEVFAESDARHALVEAAKGADLLVVGSRGHGAVANVFLGSVSEYCAGHAPCPVVIVRDPGDEGS